MRRHALITMAMALLFASHPGQSVAADPPPGGSPTGNRAGEFSISPMIGGISFAGKEHLETAPVFGARLGYNFTEHLGIEALYDYAKVKSTRSAADGDMNRYGADLLWNFHPEGKFVPNLAAGYAAMQLKPGTKGAFDLGGGFKYFVTEDMAWRGDVRGIFYDNKLDRYAVEYTTGLYIPFGGAPAPAKLPEPPAPPQAAPRTTPQVEPTVKLSLPAPVPVAPPEVELTAFPASIKRGERSVLTWKSKRADGCDMRPEIGEVGANGSLTVSPQTDTIYSLTCKGRGGTGAANAAVVVAQPTKAEKRFCNQPAILMINFDSDKWNIKPQYYGELKTVGDFLKAFPEAHGEISGHTDSTNTASYNQRLSERRAKAVRDYIVKRFNIDPKRLTWKGYGMDHPIATNKTAVGRAKNRRIEANLVCGPKEPAPVPAPESSAAPLEKESSLLKKPQALTKAHDDVPQYRDVAPAPRQGQGKTASLSAPGALAPGASGIPEAKRVGEPAQYPSPYAAAELKEGAAPSALPEARRKAELVSAYQERPPEDAAQAPKAPPPLPEARLPEATAPLDGSGAPAQEARGAQEPLPLPAAQREKQAANPIPASPAVPAPTALPSATAAAPAPPASAALSEAEAVAFALRKQEPAPELPDETPFVLDAAQPVAATQGRITLTGVTIDKDGLTLFTDAKVGEYRIITMIEPFSLVVDLYGAANGIGLSRAPVEKFDLTDLQFRPFPDRLQITLDAGREEIIPYRTYKTETGLRIDIKPRSSHHIGP